MGLTHSNRRRPRSPALHVELYDLLPRDSATSDSPLRHVLLVGGRLEAAPRKPTLRTLRLRGPHRLTSIFVDLNDEASRVWAAREALEAFRSPENDRVGVAASQSHSPLDLLVEELADAVPASP